VENFHLHHMKEVVAVLDRVAREEAIDRIVVACDDVARPLLMEQLPKELAARIVDILHADIRTPEHRVLAETLEALRQRDAETDLEHVEARQPGGPARRRTGTQPSSKRARKTSVRTAP